MTDPSPTVDAPRALAPALARLAGARVVSLAASFVGAVVVSRALGPAGRGIFSLGTSAASTAALLFTFGLPAALTWQIGQGHRPGSLTRAIVGLTVGPAAATVALLALARAISDSSYDRLPVLLTALLAAATALGLAVRSVMTGLRAYGLLAGASSVFAVAVAVMTAIVAVATSRSTATLLAAVFATGTVYGYYLFHTRLLWRTQPPRITAGSRSRWNFALLSWITNIVQEVNFRFDLLLIGLLRSPEEVGIYAAAVAIAQALWIIPTAAGEMAFAEATRSGEDGTLQFDRMTGKFMWWITGATVLAAAALWPVSSWLVPVVLGEGYRPAVEPLRLLLPGVAGFSIAHIGGNAIAGRGRPGLNMIVSVTTAVVTLAGDFLFIPRHGASAAALVSSVSYLIAMVLILFFVRRIRSDRPLSL